MDVRTVAGGGSRAGSRSAAWRSGRLHGPGPRARRSPVLDRTTDPPGTIALGGTSVEIADALVASDAYEATRLADTTLAGFAAERVDIQPPADDFTTCDNLAGQTRGAYWLWGTRVADGSDIYAQGPANRWHVWLIEADGRAVAVLYNDYAATPQADQDAAQAIVKFDRDRRALTGSRWCGDLG